MDFEKNLVKNYFRSLIIAGFAVVVGVTPSGSVFAVEGDDHHEDHEHESDQKSEHEDGEHEEHEEVGHEDHGDHEEHGEHEEAFGEGKAVTAVKGDGQFFKLSELALTTLEIKTGELDQIKGNQFEIPSGALVRFQNERGVYRVSEGWFELVKVKVISEHKAGIVVESSKLAGSDKIAVGGVPLLRVAHLQASGQGGKGHAH